MIVILEVNFPDPIKDEENRDSEALRAATYECERQLETDTAAAVPLCRQAMVATERIRVVATPQTISADYERAWQAYVTSLITAGRSQTDVDTLTRAIARRASLGRPSDQASADA